MNCDEFLELAKDAVVESERKMQALKIEAAKTVFSEMFPECDTDCLQFLGGKSAGFVKFPNGMELELCKNHFLYRDYKRVIRVTNLLSLGYAVERDEKNTDIRKGW
jgi:hypothetical protein